jgi:hypothetical protein
LRLALFGLLQKSVKVATWKSRAGITVKRRSRLLSAKDAPCNLRGAARMNGDTLCYWQAGRGVDRGGVLVGVARHNETA